jgi:hypothetical protein
MENSPLFNQVVQSLEQNENSARIKKLVFYVVKRFWAKDRNQLDSVSLTNLLQDLVTIHSDIESLKKGVYRMAQTLNKPEQYLSIASTIIAESESLYNFQTNNISLESDLITTPLLTSRPEVSVASAQLASVAPVHKKQKIEPFDLRFKVMIQANPLQTKILLFSVLEHLFDWSQPDWAALKNTELYELIRNLTYTYKSFEGLTDVLKSTARQMNKPDEYLAIANTISQALKPMYA